MCIVYFSVIWCHLNKLFVCLRRRDDDTFMAHGSHGKHLMLLLHFSKATRMNKQSFTQKKYAGESKK